jgi:four helix bundle protein
MTLNEEFLQWELSVPKEFQQDALWHSTAYRMGLFIPDRCRSDLDRLILDPRTSHAAKQCADALESISTNYAEAYSRSTSADRTRFYEYSLGSTRESRDWWFKLRRALPQPLCDEVLAFLTRIIQLLTVTIVRERGRPGKRLQRRSPRNDA